MAFMLPARFSLHLITTFHVPGQLSPDAGASMMRIMIWVVVLVLALWGQPVH